MEIKLKVKEILGEVLEIDTNIIHDDFSPMDAPCWDSLAMVNILLALEEEFEQEFSTNEVLEMRSYSKIVEIVTSAVEVS